MKPALAASKCPLFPKPRLSELASSKDTSEFSAPRQRRHCASSWACLYTRGRLPAIFITAETFSPNRGIVAAQGVFIP